MTIYITLDYELFFGHESGLIDDCIISPTKQLLDLVEPYNIKLVVFVDVGYIVKLEQYKNSHPALEVDYQKITAQIKYLSDNGHAVELHIHPHWENTVYDGSQWNFNLSQYKLSDFSKEKAYNIVKKYTETLTRIAGKRPIAYRAGGWSAQPFSHIRQALIDMDVLIDSTTFPKGYHMSKHQSYDFRSVAQYKTFYTFDEDLTKESPNGLFSEYPISSYKVSPFFFWKFALIKLRKSPEHKSYGRGSAIAKPKSQTLRLLTRFSNSVVSIDGFKASYIDKAFKTYIKHTANKGHFVIIGHPKAFTPYSLQKTKAFIERYKDLHVFTTFKK